MVNLVADVQEKFKGYEKFLSSTDTRVEYSPLWQKLKRDFTAKPTQFSKDKVDRSYGINTSYGSSRVELFIKLHTYKNRLLNRVYKPLQEGLSKLFAYVVLGGMAPAKRYRLDHPIDFKRNLRSRFPDLIEGYEELNARLGWNYSFNSLKSYAYFRILSKHFDVSKLEGANCLEIGSGICNFPIILTSHLKKYTYVCLDIPEMIPNGYYSFLANHPDKDVAVFLPQELNGFMESTADKRVLFIVPSQLDSLNLRFRFFANHESFAEMPISVVNGYLQSVLPKLENGGILHLVNRMSRCVDKSDFYDLKNYTFFSDYRLEGCETLLKEIDRHRGVSLGAEHTPNIFYIGRKK